MHSATPAHALRLLIPVLLAAAALLVLSAQPAQAATCSDYTTQAAAQFAGDTIDADHDGIYCESLPCPCSTDPPGTGSTEGTGGTAYPSRRHGRITKVVDGDTIKVKIKGRVKTVRAIGIDTPEAHKPGVPVECGAKEATSAAIKWAFRKPLDRNKDGLYDSGKKPRNVTLIGDLSQDPYDRYGRLLAYIERPGHNFARDLIRRGWGMVYVYDNRPFAQLDAFQAAQGAAQSAGLGVWGKCGGDFHSAQ